MSAERLAIITTRLPPAVCGIGTYSWLLRQHWPNENSTIEFLVMDGSAKATSLGDRVTAFNGSGTQLARELERIGSADVLLHYAGRAYQRFGCPTWMPGVLMKWKQKFPGGRLAIFFHELSGRFPITSRQFWVAKISSRIIRRLASTADLLMTNTENQAGQLGEISGRNDIHVLLVGSNIERGKAPSSPRARNEFLIFGLPFGRWQTIQVFGSYIRRWHADGHLTKLHLVGPQDDEFAKRADELLPADFIVRHGTLPSIQVSELLRRVGFALTNVSEKTWSKSGAFMACAANVCPVVIASARPESVPLCHVVGANEVASISEAELSGRTAALADWYRDNADWPVIAKQMAALWSLEKGRS